MIQLKLQSESAINAFKKAAAGLANKRPLTRRIAGIMFRAVEDNFEAEGRPRWQDLHPGTKASRARRGHWPGKILQVTGRLASSFQQSFDESHAGVGTNVPYASALHFGVRTRPHVIKAKSKRALSFGGIVVRQINHPGSNIPARPVLHLEPTDLADIEHEANSFVVRQLPK